MSTGILSTCPGITGLRRRGCARLVEHARRDGEEEPSDADQEPEDPEDDPGQGKPAAADHSAARRDALPRDESHDGRSRTEDQAKADDGARQAEDPDDQRGDRESVRALSGVAVTGITGSRRESPRRRRNVATGWRRPVPTPRGLVVAARRGRDVTTTTAGRRCWWRRRRRR